MFQTRFEKNVRFGHLIMPEILKKLQKSLRLRILGKLTQFFPILFHCVKRCESTIGHSELSNITQAPKGKKNDTVSFFFTLSGETKDK